MLLENPFGKEELKNHLSKKYGQIDQVLTNDDKTHQNLIKGGIILSELVELGVTAEDISIDTISNSRFKSPTTEDESDNESIESLLSIHKSTLKDKAQDDDSSEDENFENKV